MNKQNKIHRRKLIAGMGAGFATIAVQPVFGNAEKINAQFASPKDLEDPTTKYPRPPFKEQTQPWPGLASKMDPRPDHGENSYK
jgi:hypothetical protein